jgi:hypothetical protein
MGMPAIQYALADERDTGFVTLPLSSVRKWLHGSWALLFSHADDFAAYGFEADRWLWMVRHACASANVRPLALAHSTCHSASWVTEVGGRATALPVEDTRRYPLLRDAYEQVLCEAVRAADSRFVMILDDALRLRRTFAYDPGDRLPSPIDLIAMADRLRSEGVPGGRPPGAARHSIRTRGLARYASPNGVSSPF